MPIEDPSTAEIFAELVTILESLVRPVSNPHQVPCSVARGRG